MECFCKRCYGQVRRVLADKKQTMKPISRRLIGVGQQVVEPGMDVGCEFDSRRHEAVASFNTIRGLGRAARAAVAMDRRRPD